MDLTPDIILSAYAKGLFPMAEDAKDEDIYWFDPELRGQLPIAEFHIPKRLLKTLRARPYKITVDTAFSDVLAGCANRDETWINQSISDVFCALHDKGFTHSVEAWEGDVLVGGVYGLALGGAFFAESMFHIKTDASKICLVHLAARLHCGGFVLLDTQFINDHLLQFGAYEIKRDAYHEKLETALDTAADFYCKRFFSTPSKEGFISSASSSETSPSLTSGVDGSDGCTETALLDTFLQSRTQTS